MSSRSTVLGLKDAIWRCHTWLLLIVIICKFDSIPFEPNRYSSLARSTDLLANVSKITLAGAIPSQSPLIAATLPKLIFWPLETIWKYAVAFEAYVVPHIIRIYRYLQLPPCFSVLGPLSRQTKGSHVLFANSQLNLTDKRVIGIIRGLLQVSSRNQIKTSSRVGVNNRAVSYRFEILVQVSEGLRCK